MLKARIYILGILVFFIFCSNIDISQKNNTVDDLKLSFKPNIGTIENNTIFNNFISSYIISPTPISIKGALSFSIKDANDHIQTNKFLISFIAPDKLVKYVHFKDDMYLSLIPNNVPEGKYTLIATLKTDGEAISEETSFTVKNSINSISFQCEDSFGTLIPEDSYFPSSRNVIKTSTPISEDNINFIIYTENSIDVTEKFKIDISPTDLPSKEINLNHHLQLSITPFVNSGHYTLQLNVKVLNETKSKNIHFSITKQDFININLPTNLGTMKNNIKFTNFHACDVNSSFELDETDFSFKIIDATSEIDYTSKFEIKMTPQDLPSKRINFYSNLGLSMTPQSNTFSGNYYFMVTLNQGKIEKTKKTLFNLKGISNKLSVKELTLGSWQNSNHGSSLDIDNMQVYLLKDAKENSEKIDIWYSNEGRGNAFYSIAQAAVIGHCKDFPTKNKTLMTLIKDDFDTFKTQKQVDEKWASIDNSIKDQLLRPKKNEVALVQTAEGNIRIFKFIDGDGTNDGKALIKGKF